jgi:hypothetical protein
VFRLFGDSQETERVTAEIASRLASTQPDGAPNLERTAGDQLDLLPLSRVRAINARKSRVLAVIDVIVVSVGHVINDNDVGRPMTQKDCAFIMHRVNDKAARFPRARAAASTSAGSRPFRFDVGLQRLVDKMTPTNPSCWLSAACAVRVYPHL